MKTLWQLDLIGLSSRSGNTEILLELERKSTGKPRLSTIMTRDRWQKASQTLRIQPLSRRWAQETLRWVCRQVGVLDSCSQSQTRSDWVGKYERTSFNQKRLHLTYQDGRRQSNRCVSMSATSGISSPASVGIKTVRRKQRKWKIVHLPPWQLDQHPDCHWVWSLWLLRNLTCKLYLLLLNQRNPEKTQFYGNSNRQNLKTCPVLPSWPSPPPGAFSPPQQPPPAFSSPPQQFSALSPDLFSESPGMPAPAHFWSPCPDSSHLSQPCKILHERRSIWIKIQGVKRLTWRQQ